MLSTIQWVSLLVSVVFLLIVLDAVRRKKLKEAYALLWILTTIGMVVLSVHTEILGWISAKIGIVYPPATLFLLLIFGVLLTLFQYSIIISKHQERIMRLTQEIALLRNEVEQWKNKDGHS